MVAREQLEADRAGNPPMSRNGLEAQLEAATRDFVAKVLGILRNASLAEVAAVQPGTGLLARQQPGSRSADKAASGGPSFVTRRRRRASTKTEGLDGRIVDALTEAGEPMAARLLADKLGVPLDALGRPLKELRDAGRIMKRGDKRATKYALA
jgi:hypothetical protein